MNRRQLCAFFIMLLALPWSRAHADPHAFELDAPSARQVHLAGEMTNWEQGKLPMHKDADGKWRVSVELAPGQWLYKFVVDGQWIADPATPDRDADGRGGQHSFLFVGKGDWEERPAVPKGRIDAVSLPSRAWGKAMKLNVYLPPGFRRGQPYPVLWLLNGGGMDADQWLKTGHVERYMDNLIAAGRIRPFVIVMPSSGALPYTGKSEQFIAGELPAWLRKTYGLQPRRAWSGVAGMSLGGLGAVRLPLAHPYQYGFSIALSGYYPDELIAEVAKRPRVPMPALLLCGSEDELVTTNRKLVQALRARHASFEYREDAGGHTWQYWSHRMVEMLTRADAFFHEPDKTSAGR